MQIFILPRPRWKNEDLSPRRLHHGTSRYSVYNARLVFGASDQMPLRLASRWRCVAIRPLQILVPAKHPAIKNSASDEE
jgi:hypothetical protein